MKASGFNGKQKLPAPFATNNNLLRSRNNFFAGWVMLAGFIIVNGMNFQIGWERQGKIMKKNASACNRLTATPSVISGGTKICSEESVVFPFLCIPSTAIKLLSVSNCHDQFMLHSDFTFI